MEGLKTIPMVAIVIVIAGVIIGAAVISLSKFDETVDTCWNSSYTKNDGLCTCSGAIATLNGTSNIGEDNMSYEGYSICQSISGEGDLSEQLPTVAIIAIMIVIISIIAGVFVYMKHFA